MRDTGELVNLFSQHYRVFQAGTTELLHPTARVTFPKGP